MPPLEEPANGGGRLGHSALKRLWIVLAISGGLLGSAPIVAWGQFNGSFAIEHIHLNRENWLDWRAYQPPVTWRTDAYRAPNAMQATVGSLSQVRFFQAHDLRLEMDLGANATFLYSQHEYALFRSDPLYQEVEMRFGWDDLYGSIIGFPNPDKSLTNQGLALAWGKRTDPNTVRLSYLQEQSLYNEKTLTGARYTSAPILNRVNARIVPYDSLVVEIDYRDEPMAELVTPDAGKRERYRAQKVDLWLDWQAKDDVLIGAIYSDNTEKRNLIPDAPSATLIAADQTLSWGWTELHAVKTLSQGDTVTLALVDSIFDNGVHSSSPSTAYRFRLRTTQAFGLWDIAHSAWLHWTLSAQVGQVRLFDPGSRDAGERNDTATIQSKFGAGVLLNEARRYRFWFLSTWASDAISGQKWDGGNLQFQLFF